MEENNNYTASSDKNKAQSWVNENISFPQKVKEYTAYGTDIIKDAVAAASTALAIGFSSAGIIRTMIQPANSSAEDNAKNMQGTIHNGLTWENTRYTAKSSDVISQENDFLLTNDNKNDYLFRVGDYYLPLSYSFSVNASKNIARSQLVDGPMIYEMTSYNPVELILRIKLERKPIEYTLDGIKYSELTSEYLSFRESVNGIGGDIVKLATVLNDLYKNKSVFAIYNNFTNEEIGLQYVVLAKYSIEPSEGSTITNIIMNMLEVDLSNQTLFVEK